MANTYLQLPPEMGGQRFGPFKSGTIIQIGTDAKCQIVLGPSHGIAPVHVTITENGESYAVSPVQRGFGLFMMPAGGGQVYPISTAVHGNPGDTVILGTPAGPRFTITREEIATRPGAGMGGYQGPGGAPRTGYGGGGGGGGLAGGVAREMWRMTMARAMMRSPLYRMWYTTSFRYRTGSLNNPRVIGGIIMGIVGLIGAGTVSCGGILAKITGVF